MVLGVCESSSNVAIAVAAIVVIVVFAAHRRKTYFIFSRKKNTQALRNIFGFQCEKVGTECEY